MDLCKYKHFFGEPGKGKHKHFMGVAMWDVFLTIISGVILSLLFNWNMLNTIIIIFLLGIIVHRIFCVRTKVDKFLFK
jgi:hypothetical protein